MAKEKRKINQYTVNVWARTFVYTTLTVPAENEEAAKKKAQEYVQNDIAVYDWKESDHGIDRDDIDEGWAEVVDE
jgi:hypothetical protein